MIAISTLHLDYLMTKIQLSIVLRGTWHLVNLWQKLLDTWWLAASKRSHHCRFCLALIYNNYLTKVRKSEFFSIFNFIGNFKEPWQPTPVIAHIIINKTNDCSRCHFIPCFSIKYRVDLVIFWKALNDKVKQ